MSAKSTKPLLESSKYENSPRSAVSDNSQNNRRSNVGMDTARRSVASIDPSPQRAVTRRGSIRQTIINFKYYQAIEEVKTKNEGESDSIEDIRIEVKKYMSNSAVGRIYENLTILISIMSAIVYIHETYALDQHNLYLHQSYSLDKLDILFASFFLCDWCFHYFLADSKFYYFWSFFSWVDLIIVLSVLVTRSVEVPRLHAVNTFYNGMIYFFFAFRSARILRSLRAHVKLRGIVDAVDRYVAQMGLFAGVFILFFAALMQFLEKTAQPFPFHTWIYYISVTVATVGYGDITPKTVSGRILAMSIIAFAVVSVPFATNELIDKMKLQSVYMRAIYTPKSRNAKHILICGDLSSASMQDFFGELFHEDHDNDDLNAVILLPKPPTVEIILLMQQKTRYFGSLTYLEGSALNDVDLRRARAEIASAIFIMTNKFSSNPDEEDAKSILLNFSLKRYISEFYRPNFLFCMQLLKPENRRHLTKSQTNELENTDIVVCLNEIKMNCMAQAVLCPGANTLLMNLLTSFADDAIEIDEADIEQQSEEEEEDVRADSSAGSSASPKAWFDEYQKGCSWEIYITKLARVFDGAKFNELSYALYDRKGIVLFGLQLTDRKVPEASRLILNPGNFTIPNQDEYDIEAFVIAKNKAASDLSFAESPLAEQTAVFQMMSRKVGSVAYVLKNATVGEGSIDLGQRRKSSLKDINRLRNMKQYHNNLETLNQEDEEDEEGKSSKTPKKESKWKKLKRSSLLERKVKSDSFQEVIHRLEDDHLTNNFYVRPTPILDIQEITIKTSLTDAFPYINNHIIVTGKSFKTLYDLVKPLRSTHLGPMKYIVILHPVEIPLDVWRRVSFFDGVFFIRGSSLEDSNLKRAGVFRCSTVVVLTDANEEQLKSSNSQSLVDSDAIFTYQHVKRLNPSALVVVEIVNQTNISYLEDHTNPSLVPDPKFSPQFASGTLFTTGLLDSIVCQAYYNPEIIKVVNKLLAGMDQMDRAYFILKAAEELGHVDKNDRSDSDADTDSDEEKRQAKKERKENLPRETLLYKARRKLLKIPNSCLYQISIPENLGEKRTYGALYHSLAQQGIIPLGILRGTSSMGMGRNANKLPYVFTNPPKDTELFNCDSIFILSTKPEKVNSKMEIKDWLLNIQMQQKSPDKNAFHQHGTIVVKLTPQQQKDQLMNENYEKSYKKLEDKFKSFTSELDAKLNTIIYTMEQVLEDNGGIVTTTGTIVDDMNTIISEASMSIYENNERPSSAKSSPSYDITSVYPTSPLHQESPSMNPLLAGVFRKNSVKKRHSFSNPLVPTVHEESSNPSTTISEEEKEEEDEKDREKKNQEKLKVHERERVTHHTSGGRKLTKEGLKNYLEEIQQPPPQELKVPSMQKAISGISMDFSTNENDEEILDISPIEPIKYTVNKSNGNIQNKDKTIQQQHPAVPSLHRMSNAHNNSPPRHENIYSSFNNEEEKKGDSENEEEFRKSIDLEVKIKPPMMSSPSGKSNNKISIESPHHQRPTSALKKGEDVVGPKLMSTAPNFERLSKIKSLTDFKDTRSGKIRNIEQDFMFNK
jgi:hypothetical protein